VSLTSSWVSVVVLGDSMDRWALCFLGFEDGGDCVHWSSVKVSRKRREITIKRGVELDREPKELENLTSLSLCE